MRIVIYKDQINFVVFQNIIEKSLPFVTLGINLQNIMLSEISQSEKDKYHVISLMCGI